MFCVHVLAISSAVEPICDGGVLFSAFFDFFLLHCFPRFSLSFETTMPHRRPDDESEEDSSEEGSSEVSSSSDESSEEESSESENETPPRPTAAATRSSGTVVANKPHDEEFAVDDENRQPTPENTKKPVAGAGPKPSPQPVQSSDSFTVSGSTKIENNPHDESFAVEDVGGKKTPPQGVTRVASSKAPGGAAGFGNLKNDPNDEFVDVEDDMPEESPKRTSGPTGSQIMRNEQHDEAFDVSSPQSVSSSNIGANSPQSTGKPQMAPIAATQKRPAPTADTDDEETDDEDTSTDEDETPMMKGNTELPSTTAASAVNVVEYNPQDYAFLNSKVSREVRDLFSHITAYTPATIECPAKLRPFIPEYIPCVGDIDTFCKVPRPDERPDNLGLVVVDEPSCNQSNPAVIKIGLQYTVGKQDRETFVDSVEDAQHRPQVIDKWIADIKKLPKQLPTVTYTKPMPPIEQLMQIWPQEFEEMLASDVAIPGPGIDLDIQQYVRVLCAILDIPTYTNLVESLHVMFTLYLEFRANQHFQHS